MICPKCGKIYPEDAVFCSDCGETLKKVENENRPPVCETATCVSECECCSDAADEKLFKIISIVNLAAGGFFGILTFIYNFIAGFLLPFSGSVFLGVSSLISFAMLKSKKGNKLLNMIAFFSLLGFFALVTLVQFIYNLAVASDLYSFL